MASGGHASREGGQPILRHLSRFGSVSAARFASSWIDDFQTSDHSSAVNNMSMVGSKAGRTTMRARLLAALVIAAIAPACAAQETDRLLQQATQAAQRGEHERAVRLLGDVIASSPKTAIAWYLRGREHFR